jgi:hypothetical protein
MKLLDVMCPCLRGCSMPCHNGGECVRSADADDGTGVPRGQCACNEGFAGVSCEVRHIISYLEAESVD